MAQWIRKDHVVTIKKKDYGYGDDIPVKDVDPKVMEKYKAKGWVGSIPKPGAVSGKDAYEAKIAQHIADKKEIIKAKDEAEARVAELENSGVTPEALKEAQDALKASEKANEVLVSEVKSLKKEKTDLETSCTSLGKEKKALEAQVAKLKKADK
jgi:hypothetical protein